MKRLARDERTEVYLALRPEGVDRLCVVNLFDPARVARAGTVDRLRAEAGWLVSRVHGNLVQIYDVGQSGDRVFFLSEWVEGADLATLLARCAERGQRLPTGTAVFIALEVAAALHHIRTHEEKATGVPTTFVGFSTSSVLVSREGQVKLLHQGSCLADDPSAFSDRDWARLSLLAPEHVAGGGSPRGDVFTVAALLWQMLTGRGLAEGNVAVHRQALVSRTFRPGRPSEGAADAPMVPEPLERLVLAALAVAPEARPADLEQLRAELATILRALPREELPAIGALVLGLVGADLKVQSEELSRLGARATGMFGAGIGKAPTVTLTNFDDALASDKSIPEADLELGAPIPGTRYRALQKLGEGGMGAVYLAEHVDIEKKVALKLLHGELVRNPYVLRQFRQEARAASRIGNPYICDVTDWGEVADGRVFFVMEHLDGPSLSKVLKEQRRLEPARAIAILRQIAKALGSAHAKRIVHLDVKPDNVLLVERNGRKDNVKVVDFGIAGLLGQPGAPSRVMGTPEYMAPERAMGKAYDHRSDIYSLGVLAFEMLVGEVPFQGPTPVKTLAMQVTDQPSRLSDRAPVPEPLEALVLRLLEKDPAKRPQTMEEVEELLCEAQIDASLHTTFDDLPLPPLPFDRAARIARYMAPESRATRLTVIAASAIAAISLSVAVFFAMRDTSGGAPAGSPGGPTAERIAAPAPSAAAILSEPAVRPVAAVVSAPPSAPSPPIEGAAEQPSLPSTRTASGRTAPAIVAPVDEPETREPRGSPADPARPRDAAKARGFVERGQQALRAGRVSFAGTQFKLASEADATNAAAWAGLAEVAFEEADYGRALLLARKAIRHDARRPKYHVLFGHASVKLKKFDQALRAYERARALAPGDPDIQDSIASVKRYVN